MCRKIFTFKNFNLKNFGLIIKNPCYSTKDSYKHSSVNAFRKDCEYHSLVHSFTHIQSKAGNNNKEEGTVSKATLLLVTRM